MQPVVDAAEAPVRPERVDARRARAGPARVEDRQERVGRRREAVDAKGPPVVGQTLELRAAERVVKDVDDLGLIVCALVLGARHPDEREQDGLGSAERFDGGDQLVVEEPARGVAAERASLGVPLRRAEAVDLDVDDGAVLEDARESSKRGKDRDELAARRTLHFLKISENVVGGLREWGAPDVPAPAARSRVRGELHVRRGRPHDFERREDAHALDSYAPVTQFSKRGRVQRDAHGPAPRPSRDSDDVGDVARLERAPATED
mmetsp:Transcript_22101/g.75943  ORF Transcript_22101/g.75943 Transcript_22101/m.75943 type:complete len:263 (+) Transcript_22101:505-1293(+)